MYPDCYPTFIIKWGIIPAIHPFELFFHRIGQFHSEMAPVEEENWWLLVPVLLIVATYVRELWHHHSRVLL